MRMPTRPWRFAGLFALAAALVAAAGVLYESRQLGWTDQAGAAVIEAQIRREFGALSTALDSSVEAVAGKRDLLMRSPADRDALRALFDTLTDAAGRDLSLTVYSADAAPIAWAGRPSDLPRPRVVGPSALLVAPSVSGPRLVRIQPIVDTRVTPARRAGAVVAELPLPSTRAPRGIPTDRLIWTTALVPVAVLPRYEGAGEASRPGAFLLADASGNPVLEGRIRLEDIADARSTVRDRSAAAFFGACALFAIWMAIPLLDWRRAARTTSTAVGRTAAVVCAVLAARAMAWLAVGLAGLAVPMDARDQASGAWHLVLRSPTDFLLTSATLLALVALAGDSLARLRPALKALRRPAGDSVWSAVVFVPAQLAAGTVVAVVFSAYLGAGRALTDTTSIDWLRFSLHPWEAGRLAVATGLVLWHASAVWAAVGLLRIGLAAFRVSSRMALYATTIVCWSVPTAVAALVPRLFQGAAVAWEMGPPALLAVTLAWSLPRLTRWRRHSSQAASIVALFAALALPAVSLYPAAFSQANRTKQQLVETRLAPDATRQRSDVQMRVWRATRQVDAVDRVSDLVRDAPVPTSGPVPTDAAFLVWSETDLASFRLTSSIELYGRDGALVSRFALNLPELTSTQQSWKEAGCGWDLFEEVSPFLSEERRLLHAGRGVCVQMNGRSIMVGSIVIHAMLDYATLPFFSSQNPYVELFRTRPTMDRESSLGRDVAFVVYGWSLRPIYTSGPGAWTLDATTFRRAYQSRTPFWTRQEAGDRTYDVFLANDRGGIYAIGYPTVSPVGHLIFLAELLALVGAVFVLALLLWGAGAAAAGVRGERGRDLLREIRASFYRKLFLAFVAAAVIPVLTLAFISRAYVTARLRADVEEAAVRTTNVAQRVVEDYGLMQQRGEAVELSLSDDILVWISRVIDQDVNVFEGPRLVATSERDLFASGLLPTRTSAGVYKAIVLDRRASFVGEERAGQFPYMVAAAPVRIAGLNTLLTVPLTMRQQAIEREIDDLNRRMLLAVLAFILIGSAIGYWMAERIADPVNRLQRATTRLARGDLDARVAVTSSDELRRLVEAFNRMAAELQRQQVALERTHRLEAWADMARQVAHEIKNPLTPIQLSAEHLRRVNADRGTPLSPVLDGCVDSILTQVRLLRQIAAEFSSFASAPTPRPVPTRAADLVTEVVEPYRTGLAGRVQFDVDVPEDLPWVSVDRSLVGRALTNMVDNALHAMPAGGTLSVTGRPSPDAQRVHLAIRDTGVGMDPASLGRIFEPYFSTKAVGTGLGLTIAKRNIELHAGTIEVASAPGHGTTVTVTLPACAPEIQAKS